MHTIKLSVLVALCACALAAPLAPTLTPGLLPAEQEPSPAAPSGNVTSAVAAARLKKYAPGTCITVTEPGKAPFTLCNPATGPTAEQPVAPEARTFGHHDEALFKPKIKFVKVPVVKHLKVPVAAHEFEPHYGHRSSAAYWLGPDQTFAAGAFGAPAFDQARNGEQQALAATAVEAEMALQTHLMNEQARSAQAQIMEQHELEKARAAHELWMNEQAFERARHARAQMMYQQELEQARFAEAQMMHQQQLEHARQAQSPSGNVAGADQMAAHVPGAQAAEQARAAQLEQAMKQQAFEQAMAGSARSAVSYAPLPVINNYLPTYPAGAYAASVFPASPGGGGCGALPLLFSCSPQLVRGHVAHAGHAAHGGGGYHPAAAWAGGGGSYRETEQHPGSAQASAPQPAKDEKKSEAAATSTAT